MKIFNDLLCLVIQFCSTEIINQGDSMSAESKALYAKALLPYAKSVAKTAKLSGPIKDFIMKHKIL